MLIIWYDIMVCGGVFLLFVIYVIMLELIGVILLIFIVYFGVIGENLFIGVNCIKIYIMVMWMLFEIFIDI